ncbi:hypothetical protein CPB83DRAFT_860771 [Crepidotus variabilis]|uniref:Uncharacterized protein n=1 Tax=Crepidotus variabilis TaxID=179855 RepID=A0A9P6E904_9AGAR|nr:hypothetical protein CPB83DRAFT_860771 [Crepidotus variabilis]
MPPPHLSLSENMNQPSNTDSPRSASSSTLIITALPSLPGGMASSSLSKLVELDPINGDSTRGAEDVSTPATAAGQAAKSPRPNLRLHTMPSNPHSQSQSQSLDRMSHKGFIEPHRSHLPRRAAKSKSKEKGRRNTVGEEEKIQRLEVVRMQRIESVATQPDFESTPDATKAEVEIERIPSAQTDNTDLPLERFAVPHTSPLPPSQNQPHTSGLPYPLPLMSPGLPHPAMGLTMGLMQAAERKAKEREEELRVAHDEREKGREDRERTPIPATVGGVKGTPYLTLNLGAGDEDGEEDEEAEESRERVAGVGVGLGLGGVGGLGGLGLGVSIGALSPPIQTSHPQQKQQRRSASQTRVPLGLEGISGLPPVPQTAPVGGPVYSGIGGGGGGGRATGTGPTAFNLPRRHHRRGRDKGKVQSPSPSPNANVQDVLKAVNTPLPMSPPQPVARPLGFGLINDTTTRPQLHHREDSMDIRGRQGEGEVRLLRVERVERVEKGVDGDVNLEDEDEDDSTREVKAAIDSHAPNGPHTLHLPNTAHTPNQRNQLNAHNDNVVHSLDDGSLSIERRMRSPGPAMYRTRQAVVREEAVGVGLGGISGVGGVGSLRKIGPKAGLGLEDEEMKRKERLVKERREEDKRSLQVVGWTRVEVGFLSDAEERDAGVGGGGGKGRGMPFVELRVVEPCLDEPKDDNDNSNQNDARSMRLYLPAVKPDGLDEDSSRADASKSVPTSAPDESTPVLGVEFQETQEPDGLAPSSIPFPVTLTPITPLATLPPAPIASLPNPGAVPKSEKPPASSSSSPSPTPSPYLDGIPSLTFSQLREGCAFISKWLGGDSFVDHTTVMQGHDVVDVDAKKKTKEEDSERRWIRILAPRWRPEDALALGLCWAVGVESGAGRVEHAGVLNENENEDEESVKQEDKEEVVVKLEDEQEEEAKRC